MKKNKIITISLVLAVVSILCIVSGAYALFNYYKKGTIDNEVTTGKITFRYDETSVQGINLQNAMPILDMQGTILDGEGEYFDFSVSTQGTNANLSYQIELETTEDSTLDPSIIKVYLTELSGDNVETADYYSIKTGTIPTYNQLDDNDDKTAKIVSNGHFTKFQSTYAENKYRLRIWVDKNADFSPLKNEDGTYQTDEEGNYIYPYNNQTFKVRVNVKATTIIAGGGDIGVMTVLCTSNLCPAGNSVTLADNSSWTLINDYNAGDETIKLLYDGLIDENGNYTSDETLYDIYRNYGTFKGERDEFFNLTNSTIQTALSNFTPKLKNTLSDENIIVSIPTTEMFGFDFDKDLHYPYYAASENAYIPTNKNFVINSSTNTDLISKYLWIVDGIKIIPYTYSDSYPYSSKYGIKPVITVSSSYLEQAFNESSTDFMVCINNDLGAACRKIIGDDVISDLKIENRKISFESYYSNHTTITVERVDDLENPTTRESVSISDCPVNVGNNYFIVNVVSENGKYNNEYKLTVNVPESE